MPPVLPEDVLKLICKKLDSKSLIRFDQTCKRVHKVVKEMRAQNPALAFLPQFRSAHEGFGALKKLMAELREEHGKLQDTVDSLKKFKSDEAWQAKHKKLIDQTAEDMRFRRQRMKNMSGPVDFLIAEIELLRQGVKKAEEAGNAKIVAAFTAMSDTVIKWRGELSGLQRSLDGIATDLQKYTKVKV